MPAWLRICFFRIGPGGLLLLAVCSSLAAAPPLGQLYDVGGYRLHMTCMGEGEPTVVFDAGVGGFSLEWIKIQRELQPDVRTCAYDRAGYGWSDRGPSPRSTSLIADELRRLLQLAEIPPPYVLVGHSFGGYNMQYFAKLYPEQVAAVILVDSSHPEQSERMPQVTIRQLSHHRPHIVTVFADRSIFLKYPEDVRTNAMLAISSRKAIVTRRQELVNLPYSGSEVMFAGNFPDVPLIVITRGQRVWPEEPLGDALEVQWQRLQQELVQLSPRGRQIIASYSGHMVHMDEPYLVADVVRGVVSDLCEPRIQVASACH